MTSNNLSETFLVNNYGKASVSVDKPATKLATKPS